jgi:hypothetical protein
MIGGHDVAFPASSPAQAMEGVVRLVCAAWPGAVVENAETGELLSGQLLGVRESPSEVLVYRNDAARNSWAADGATADNVNSMVHIIRGEQSITLVIDDPAKAEMSAMLLGVGEHLRQDIFWMRADAA